MKPTLLTYVQLALAIAAEVIATSSMKLSDGFSRVGPSIVTVVFYAISFFLLAQTLRSLPTGIVYAIWSGAGIVLIALVAWLFQGQRLDAAAIAGMALIVAGVAVMNLLSRSSLH